LWYGVSAVVDQRIGVVVVNRFRALVVNQTEDDFFLGVQELSLGQLPAGDVTIRVFYSSVNYKDGMASVPNSRIVRSYPFVPGIDLAGQVIHSDSPRFKEGDEVLITGYELGVSHYGGFSQVARVPAEWVVPIPKGLSMKEAMAIGTAGFTAALSVHRLEENHLTPDKGPVLVTGASGGVGSTAVAMLSRLGYDVTASSRKVEEHPYLRQLGAKAIIAPEALIPEKNRPLQSEKWAGVVDPVGGKYLPHILSAVKYGGSVALSGLTAGVDFATTVYPFILRGVNLLGIDSVYCPMEVRTRLWDRIANELKPNQLLESISGEISLDDLPDTLGKILRGEVRGRMIVSL
jgi:acrylyl-CoA reductase (NADPH)